MKFLSIVHCCGFVVNIKVIFHPFCQGVTTDNLVFATNDEFKLILAKMRTVLCFGQTASRCLDMRDVTQNKGQSGSNVGMW